MADGAFETVPGEVIRLAEEPEFRLGAARVIPSNGEIGVGAHIERLEPRVMQVLVALARAEGRVVSRDSLAASCWAGRVVGEDAINRALSTLRALARRLPEATFEIETLPRIGYRLSAAPGAAAPPAPAARRGRPARRFALAASALVLVAALGVGAVFATARREPADWDVEGYRVVVGSGADERSPALSPDGRFLVYTSAETDSVASDIYLQGLAGGTPVRLAASPDDDVSPAWAPSGDRIAFVRTDPVWRTPAGQGGAKPCRILVKPVPDGPERVVGRCLTFSYVSRLDWTPDGKGLVYTDAAPGARPAIFRLDLATGRATALTHPRADIHGDFNAAISPDGRTLAFRRYLSTQSGDIHLQDLRSGRLVRLTRDGGVGYLSWTPNGQNLIVSSLRDGGHDLWRMPIDPKAKPQRLSWGRSIYRASAAAGLVAFEIGAQPSDLLRLHGAAATPLTTGVRENSSPDVSPAGDVAFINGDDGGSVWLQRRGRPPQKLLDLPLLDARGLRWSPDGRTLAFLANAPGAPTAIYLLGADTAALRRLDIPGAAPIGLSWSADGRSLVAPAAEPRGSRIWRVPLARGARPEPISGFGWRWAEAGPAAVYALREGQDGVWRLASGAAPVRIAPVPHTRATCGRWDSDLTWTVRVYGDRLHIWETRPDASRVDHWSLPLEGGPVRREGALDGRLQDFAIDPATGDAIAYRAIPRNGDIAVVRVKERARGRAG